MNLKPQLGELVQRLRLSAFAGQLGEPSFPSSVALADEASPYSRFLGPSRPPEALNWWPSSSGFRPPEERGSPGWDPAAAGRQPLLLKLFWRHDEGLCLPKVFETQKVEVSSPEVGANVGDLFSNAKS